MQIPKYKIKLPSRREMPFDASGRLKPNGPDFAEPPGIQPDIEGLPWKRLGPDSWTSEAQRAVVKDFIQTLIADNPAFSGWEVVEKNTLSRSAERPMNPYLIISLVRKSDASEISCAIEFDATSRSEIAYFTSRLSLVGPSLLAQL